MALPRSVRSHTNYVMSEMKSTHWLTLTSQPKDIKAINSPLDKARFSQALTP